MARKVEVRRQISQELGVETAKEFDELYAKIKKSSGDIVLIEEGHHLTEVYVDEGGDISGGSYIKEGDNWTGGRGWVGVRCDDVEVLMDEMRNEVERLKENALQHRKDYPHMYRRHPHLNNHLFV